MKKLIKALDNAELKAKSRDIPKVWVYKLKLIYENGEKAVVSIVDDITLICNGKLCAEVV